jgi:hypothetical protein
MCQGHHRIFSVLIRPWCARVLFPRDPIRPSVQCPVILRLTHFDLILIPRRPCPASSLQNAAETAYAAPGLLPPRDYHVENLDNFLVNIPSDCWGFRSIKITKKALFGQINLSQLLPRPQPLTQRLGLVGNMCLSILQICSLIFSLLLKIWRHIFLDLLLAFVVVHNNVTMWML